MIEMRDFLLVSLVLPAGFALDFLFGDPQWKYHPIRIMGNLIEAAEPWFRKLPVSPLISGGLFAVTLILGVFAFFWLLIARLWVCSPLAGFVAETILIFFCISAKDLKYRAVEIYKTLMEKKLQTARNQLSMIVGRETQELDEEAVARACVETVAENLVDGVIAPILFAAVGGAPLALAYKMTNTLDSMTGYKNDKYSLFGRVAAKIDDAVNWLPARISVPIIALAAQLLAKKGRAAFQTAKEDSRKHSSPNAGHSEAAFSGTLSVRFGGPNRYHGKIVKKPYIGRRFGPTAPYHILQACDLMTLSSILALIVLWGGRVLAGILIP